MLVEIDKVFAFIVLEGHTASCKVMKSLHVRPGSYVR